MEQEDIARLDTAARFAELRAACDAVLQLDGAARVAAIAALEARDPSLARDVAALIDHVDEGDLLPPEHDDVEPGALVGPFRILRSIGRGGMGEVYLAERVGAGFEQRVALKLVPRAIGSDALHRRFVRERQLLARLEHVGIARLIDGGFCDSGRPWLAMEYVDGLSLMRHAQHHALDIDQRVALIRDVCAAVAHAHQNLVVHRDLKPGNILVDAAGRTRLLDFGIARLLDDSDLDLTRTGAAPMTFRYAAPEQIAGERSTTAVDIHALGVILFELISEALPERTTGGAIAGRRLPGAPLPHIAAVWRRPAGRATRALHARVAGDLDRIVQKATATDPDDRYAGAASLDGDLADWLARRPLRSGIGGARQQTRYLLHRYRWPIAMAAIVTAAIGCGALLAWQQALKASRQAVIANAHLEALLDVLGSANPHKYAGRDPAASEFLLSAAQRIRTTYAADPVLSRRALTEIGHGLINLGRPAEAEQVLAYALAAADRDPNADARATLGVLALLVQVQDTPSTQDRLATTVARIERLADRPGAPPAAIADALARAGGTLSRMGQFDAATRALDRAASLLDAHPGTDASIVENYLRQRGWSALRALDLPAATAAFTRAATLCHADPARFSAMRCAEGELLLAETTLLAGDVDRAGQYLQRAQPVYFAEYDIAHPERAAFELLLAQWALLDGDTDRADTLLARVQSIFAAHVDEYATEQATTNAWRAATAAALGRCADAGAALATATQQLAAIGVPLPRESAMVERSRVAVRKVCQLQ